jgi:S-adenosylmethionine synthetase
VNAADDPAAGSFYLTVTGTSAESGDDGEVGRGNRVNGLITPGRPMTLEAAAGKNPVSHVGKLYNLLAREIANDVVTRLPDVVAAECVLVSRIGAPVDEPAVVSVHVRARDGRPAEEHRLAAEEIARDNLGRLGTLGDRLIAGDLEVY